MDGWNIDLDAGRAGARRGHAGLFRLRSAFHLHLVLHLSLSVIPSSLISVRQASPPKHPPAWPRSTKAGETKDASHRLYSLGGPLPSQGSF